jgi:hypothetical protein
MEFTLRKARSNSLLLLHKNLMNRLPIKLMQDLLQKVLAQVRKGGHLKGKNVKVYINMQL